MKLLMNVIGGLLILLGLIALGYKSISYTQKEKVAQFGELQVTADKEKIIYFPPIISGAAVVAGVVMLIVFNRPKK